MTANNHRIKFSAKMILAGTLFFLILAGNAMAGTYYVAPSGNASWNSAANIASPCNTATAMANAKAGDVVLFRGGVYNIGTWTDYHAKYIPANSGTSNSPITFKAYTGETPVFTCTAGRSGYQQFTVFGTDGRSYIVFDGFTFGNGVTWGGRCILGGYTGPFNSVGCVYRNCTFIGVTTNNFNDNREGLRISAINGLVQNCVFDGYKDSGGSNNISGIKCYWNQNTVVENCEFRNNSIGMHEKSATHLSSAQNSIFRNNFVHDNEVGWHHEDSGGSWDDKYYIYNNLFVNNSYQAIDISKPSQISDDIQIVNNTIYGPGQPIFAKSASNMVVHSNILMQTSTTGYSFSMGESSSEFSLLTCERNQWGNIYFKAIMRLDSSTSPYKTSYSSLSSWQSSGELSNGGNPGTGSLASNPQFKNGSGSLSQISDFELSSGSPCIGAGRNGVNMGADVSLVGTSGLPGSTLLLPPQNFRRS